MYYEMFLTAHVDLREIVPIPPCPCLTLLWFKVQ